MMTAWSELSGFERDILVTLQRLPQQETSFTALVESLDALENSPSESALSKRLDELEQKGFVRRYKRAPDLRETRCEVTADGQRVLEEQCEQMIDAVGWDVLQPAREDDLVTDGGVFVTEHAADRWDQRTPAHSVAPETAWEQSERRNDLQKPGDFAEVRLHRPTGVVLGRCGSAIVTVLPHDRAPAASQEVQG